MEIRATQQSLHAKEEVIVANKIDLDPEGKAAENLAKRLKQKVYPISAVTGEGIKELSESLWQKVKELKGQS